MDSSNLHSLDGLNIVRPNSQEISTRQYEVRVLEFGI